VDAVDPGGSTAIEQMNSEESTSALLAAGALLPADPARRKAMRDKAAARQWTSLLPALGAEDK